jgi:hypothetical protein
MRTTSAVTFAFVLASLLSACGTQMMGDDSGDDDGSGDGSGSDDDVLEPPVRGFQIVTPDITIQAHEEITYCYYFKMPTTEAYTVKKWESVMTAGSHHLILFTTPSLVQPEGTVTDDSCSLLGGGSFTNVPTWVYSAQTTPASLPLPADDGTGKPVGMDIAAGQPAFVQMHYNNTGDEAIIAKATINAIAYDVDVQTTKTFAYVSYDSNISIDPNGIPHTESLDCDIDPASKVWLMTTHAHRHAVHTEVRNGTDVMFESDDWEHPGASTFMDAPFYSFSTGTLTSSCTWVNNDGVVIKDGDSAQTEEMCMASGYYFPATKPAICYNGYVF